MIRNVQRSALSLAVIIVLGAFLTFNHEAFGAQLRGTATRTPAEDQLIRASQQWFEAVARADADATQPLEVDDFLSIQLSGRGLAIADKAAQLEGLRRNGAPSLKLTRELSNIRIRTYGNTAILTATATFHDSAKGALVGQALTTEVWVNMNGAWRMAHFQPVALPLPPAK